MQEVRECYRCRLCGHEREAVLRSGPFAYGYGAVLRQGYQEDYSGLGASRDEGRDGRRTAHVEECGKRKDHLVQRDLSSKLRLAERLCSTSPLLPLITVM